MKILICLCLCFVLAGCAPAQKPEPTAPAAQPKIETREEEYQASVGYGSIYCQDPSLPAGKQEVLFSGKTGLSRQSCRVTYIDGEKTQTEVIWEELLEAPVSQVVAVGTGESPEEERAFPLFGDNCIITEEGQVLKFSHQGQFQATADTAGEPGVDGITATGTQARVGAIAVDPKVIPYGTKMFILSEDGKYIYGEATAEDCGGLIKGNRIDLYFDTLQECYTFGVRMCQVYFLI